MKNTYENTWIKNIALFICIFSFGSCVDDGNFKSWDGVLRMEVDAMSMYNILGTDPNDVVFNIKSNTPWEIISSDLDWCIPSPSSSEKGDGATVKVTFNSNENLKTREATLTIKANGVIVDKIINISQEPKELFEIRPFEGLVSTEGGVIEFGVRSNKPWVIKTSSQFLTNIDKRTGSGSETDEEEIIKITIPESETIARKSGIINISTETREYSFDVFQDGYYIELENQSPIILSGFGEERFVNIISNIDWSIEVPEEVQNLMSVEKISKDQIKINMAQNANFISRSGLIKLIADDEKFAELNTEVKISQSVSFNFTGCGPDDDGIVKVASTATIVPTYFIKKGEVKFQFNSTFLSTPASIFIEFKSADVGDNGSFRLVLDPSNLAASGFWAGGTFGYHAYTKTPFTYEGVNSMKSLVISLQDSETEGKINIKAIIDGNEVAMMSNRTDIWLNSPEKKGVAMTVKLQKPNASDHTSIESIAYTPF